MPVSTYTAAYLSSAIADQARFPADELEVHDCGLTLRTRWDLKPGTEIEFGASTGYDCQSCQGIVVDCYRCYDEDRHFCVTLFFTQQPCPEFKRILEQLRDDLD